MVEQGVVGMESFGKLESCMWSLMSTCISFYDNMFLTMFGCLFILITCLSYSMNVYYAVLLVT